MKKRENEISELKEALLKAQQDIEKLSKVKSDFVSIISHELRTPLTSIKESISILLDGVAGPINENQKKFLEIAKNNIGRLTKIITDILDFSKMESGRIAMHKRKIDINEVIKDVYKEVKSNMEQKGLYVNMELSDGVEPVWLDPDRIRQALRNLLSNAMKFNRQNGSVKILSGIERLDGKETIKVVVEDTGFGISKEDMPQLFKHFNPLDTGLTRSYSGVGLGLAISKSIIQLHGGEIWAESEKDRGSRFIFTLPIYRKDDEFNFLLDEAMERAKNNDMKLSLIILRPASPDDASDEILSELEKTVRSTVRGPEDKVVRFGGGDLISVMANTGPAGAGHIINRLRPKIKFGLNFGISIYPDDVIDKEALIKKAEGDLKSKKDRI